MGSEAMSGYVLGFGACITCKRLFAFNPHKVPSTSAITGTLGPVCEVCMTVVNIARKEKGLQPFEIQPDAYEPLPEGEL
jgi:hypothetical protein